MIKDMVVKKYDIRYTLFDRKGGDVVAIGKTDRIAESAQDAGEAFFNDSEYWASRRDRCELEIKLSA